MTSAKPRKRHWVRACGACLVALFGCADSRTVEDEHRNTDTPALSVSATPAVTLGALDDPREGQFVRVAAAALRSDGGLVVGDAALGVVRWYDASGRFVRELARRGSGPGEFRALTQLLVLHGDTTVLWDATLRRISRFDADGALLDVTTVDAAPLAALAAPPLYLSSILVQASGDLVLRLAEQPGKYSAAAKGAAKGGAAKGGGKAAGPGPAPRTRAVFLRTRSDGSRADTIGDLADTEVQSVDWPGLGPISMEPLLARRPLIAISPRGAAVCVGDQSAPVVDCLRPYVSGVESIGWSAQAVPVDQRAVREWRDSLTDVLGRKLAREDAAAVANRVSVPDSLPPYSAVLLDDLDRLWVQVPEEPARAGWSRFRVFGRGGVLVGSVDVPLVRVLAVSERTLVGVSADEDGVESVLVYGLGVQPR